MASITLNSTNSTQTLSDIFTHGLSLHAEICSGESDQRTEVFQNKVRQGIMILEDATRMVSALDLFSRNESISDISTETLKYFLLPVLLGRVRNLRSFKQILEQIYS